MWNFDEEIPRENTACIKYDWREKVFGRKDVIPMWVADMDFRTPPFITEALRNRLSHEILGYSYRTEGYHTSLINWIRRRHGWDVSREWLDFSPGVVPALNLCTLAYTDPGDEIIIQTPVYTPFHSAAKDHGRKLIFNKLRESEGRWMMDFKGLHSLITPASKMIIISNPHNPVGRVWRKDELEQLVEICAENNIVIISDEIHSDLIMPGHKHVPLASLSEKAASVTVTCMAPSKTFNLAGLSTSFMVIPDTVLRGKYARMLGGLHLHIGNIFGAVASEAAYTFGHEWVDDLMHYVSDNTEYLISYCSERIPQIKPVRPEATYMIWLDCRALGMSGQELFRFFVDRSGVGMNEGSAFGPGGEGFMRMNLACPRTTVTKALTLIEKAIRERHEGKQ